MKLLETEKGEFVHVYWATPLEVAVALELLNPMVLEETHEEEEVCDAL